MLPIKITDRWRGSRYRQRQCGSPPRYQLTTRSSCSLYESWVANEVVRNSAQFRPTKSYFVSYRDSHQTKRKGNQPRISDLSPFCPKLVRFWFFFSSLLFLCVDLGNRELVVSAPGCDPTKGDYFLSLSPVTLVSIIRFGLCYVKAGKKTSHSFYFRELSDLSKPDCVQLLHISWVGPFPSCR